MSKATKRKHVTKEVLDEFILPTENQQVVRVSIGLVSIKPTVIEWYLSILYGLIEGVIL